jgi:hypothetical protein
MGLDLGKSYSAKEIKKALEDLNFTVLKCEPSSKNFVVQVSGGPNAIGNTGISLSLDGKKGMAGGLVGQHGLSGISKSQL